MSQIETFIEKLDGKPILVYGAGKSGAATAKALAKAGATIWLGDDSTENLKKTKHANIEHFDADNHNLEECAFLVLSPGIPLYHPKPHNIVTAALGYNLEIMCDIELFNRIYPNIKTIGITGTNGKSTTTFLTYHILKEQGVDAEMAGNIGTAIFDLKINKNPEKHPEWMVLEISSFQMDLCPTFRPDIGIILNITPDHIDRHGTMERYTEAKANIIDMQALQEGEEASNKKTAIICTDDSHTQKIYDRVEDEGGIKLVQIATEKKLSSGIFVEKAVLKESENDTITYSNDLTDIKTLNGIHNQQNAACAYAVARALAIMPEKIWQSLESFPGLNHRQFLVRTINGVDYVNDSKSTNAASAAVALACRSNIYWIVGGRKKKTGLDGLERFFNNIKHAFLMGEASDDFAKWFDKYGIAYTRCETLERAVDASHKMAQDNRGQPGGAGTVLLSPACASFDQFQSFEDRGDQFASMIEAIED